MLAHHPPRLSLIVVFSAICTPGLPSAATAQAEFSTYVGIFHPTRHLGRFETVTPLLGTSRTQIEHRDAVATGVRLTLWLGGHLGIETTVVYAQSELAQVTRLIASDLPEPFTVTATRLDATVLSTTGRLQARLPVTAGSDLRVAGGLGLLWRAGDAFQPYDGTTSLTFAAGTGITTRVTSHFSVRIDVEDYMSSPELSRPGIPTRLDPEAPETLRPTTRTQHDLVLSAAVSLILW